MMSSSRKELFLPKNYFNAIKIRNTLLFLVQNNQNNKKSIKYFDRSTINLALSEHYKR